MASSDAKVTLRIFSSQLSCDKVSELMMLQPTNWHEKGSPVSKSSSSVRADSLWLYSPELDICLEEQVEFLADLLANVDSFDTFKNLVTIEFFCSVSSENGQGNIYLSKSIIRKLSDLGVELSVDYYFL